LYGKVADIKCAQEYNSPKLCAVCAAFCAASPA